MRILRTLIQLPLLLGAIVQAIPSFDNDAGDGIEWGACSDAFKRQVVNDRTIECGKLAVPLDYDLPKGVQINVNILRIRAPKWPVYGSIFFSLGSGPGSLARQSLMDEHDRLLSATGYRYHLIAFDARGTGDTLPMTCFNSTAEPFRYTYLNDSNTDMADLDRKTVALADTCYKEKKDIGKYMGTASVARDMMSLVDALEKDKLLRFWGTSYGAMLGATVAAMFPDRIDKILFDGAVNAHDYYNSYEVEAIKTADDVQMGLFEGCIKQPLYCRLTRSGFHNTAQKIEETYHKFLYQLNDKPILYNGTVITYTMLKRAMALTLRRPSEWARFSLALHNLYQNSPRLFVQYYDNLTDYTSNHYTAEAAFGIGCGDKSAGTRMGRYRNLPGLIVDTYQASMAVGEETIASHLTCANWKMYAKERYEGNFDVRTNSPALFIGTAYDPVTSIVSAENMSASFENSVLLRHEGYGNGLLAQPSVCTLKAVRDYFRDNKMPPRNTKCKPDMKLFDWRSASNFYKELDELDG